MGILYFITPFTICLPMMWKTHIYPAVWANCNMFREYSNTPYLAGFVGLLIFWYWCVFSKLYGFFHSPTFICLLWKCFLHIMKSLKKKKRLKKFVDHKEHCRPMCRHTLFILSILMMHINWAFSVHDDKHNERVLYYYLFNMGQQGICMCVCFCI